ncbi:hypothetical protein VNO77_34498 [Canavalia gladiata]|uniref:Uncharacterized protein n=1 Tax=Canavalia gladiata TaxID=3824 RepID=A0AAN9KFM2_CANGL
MNGEKCPKKALYKRLTLGLDLLAFDSLLIRMVPTPFTSPNLYCFCMAFPFPLVRVEQILSLSCIHITASVGEPQDIGRIYGGPSIRVLGFTALKFTMHACRGVWFKTQPNPLYVLACLRSEPIYVHLEEAGQEEDTLCSLGHHVLQQEEGRVRCERHKGIPPNTVGEAEMEDANREACMVIKILFRYMARLEALDIVIG